MADFTFSDSFLDLPSFGRRPAAYPPLGEADTDTQVQALTRGALTSLGYVGSTLDKLTGARAIRGALAGKPRELLSVVPGSDVFGLTDEADTTHAEDLLRQHLGYDPSQGNWAERNLVGPGLELALDPATYLGGVGALTKLGKAAAKTGTVTPGFLAAVRSGQRSAHPLVALAGKLTPGLADAAGVPWAQRGAAATLEGTGALGSKINVGVRKVVPGVAPLEDLAGAAAGRVNVGLKSLFDRPSGPIPDPDIQQVHRTIKYPGDLEAEAAVRGDRADLYGMRDRLLADIGVELPALNRYIKQAATDVPTDLHGPFFPGVQGRLDTLVDEIKAVGRTDPEQIEAAAGLPFKRLQNETDEAYALRRKLPPAGKSGVVRAFMDAIGARTKLFKTTHPSMMARQDAVRNWFGGDVAIEDLMTTELAGAKPTLGPAAIDQRLLQDQLDRLHVARGRGWSGVPVGPVGPEMLDTLKGRSSAMRGFLGTVPPEKIAGGIPGRERLPFFDPDPIANATLRKERAMKADASARSVYAGIGTLAPKATGAPSDVPVLDVLGRMKLTSEPALRHTLAALGIDAAPIDNAAANALRWGVPFDVPAAMRATLKGKALPERQAAGISRLINRWQVPEEVEPWLRLSDAMQNAWKTGVYTIWPGSLMRNVGSGMTENVVEAGQFPGQGKYRMADRALRGEPVQTGIQAFAHLGPVGQRSELLREAYMQGPVIFGGHQGEVSERVGLAAPSGAMGNPLAPRQSIPSIAGQLVQSLKQKGWRGLGDIPEIGKSLSQAAEDRLRLSEYATLRAQGFTADAATARVARTHFNYSDASDFEKSVMRRLVPFYTYPRKNLPKQLGRAITNPLAVGGPIRFSGMNQDQRQGNYVPEYLRGGLALPLGESAPGMERYLSSLGLPLEEAFGRLKVGQGPLDTLNKTAEAYLGLLRPGIRAPLESMTGRQFFTGRDLKDLHVGVLEGLASLGDPERGRTISQLMSTLPTSRAIATADRLLDTRKYTGGPVKTAIAQALPLLSGARITDVDIEKWKNVDARNQLERLLQSSQHIRENKDYFADKTARLAGEITPEEATLLRTYASLKLRAEEAIREKRRVGVQLGR